MANFLIENLGRREYKEVFQKMVDFNKSELSFNVNKLWCVEHFSVFTQGRNGLDEHILDLHNIPLIKVDRGGQITYHGEGQAVIYFLCDLKSLKVGIKKFVENIELSVIELLEKYNIKSHLIENSPGIYVENSKIASLGLRVKRGKTYHGLAINVDMDLSPFKYINPCGYKNLTMCQIKDFRKKTIKNIVIQKVFKDFCSIFINKFE